MIEIYNPFCVAVTAPLDVLEAREEKREDREKGLARYQHAKIHQNTDYDCYINTHQLRVDQAAELIRQNWQKI